MTDLDDSIARSLDADPVLLPVLEYLLQDLDMLGAVPSQIVEMLHPLVGGAPATAIELACGKGAVSLALAERLGFLVTGIDAYAPFVEEALAAAAGRGLSERCRFHCADVRALSGRLPACDVVLLLSAGAIFGGAAETVAALRCFVRPGGLIVVEDAYATAPDDPLPDYDAIVAGLTAGGEAIVAEWCGQVPEGAAFEARAVQAIERRVREMVRLYPGLAASMAEYVATQRREAARLGDDLIPAVWVLRTAE